LRISKRTYDNGSNKRKLQCTAKAGAPRAVFEKKKPKTQFFSVPEGPTPSVGLTIVANVAVATAPAVFYNKSYSLQYMQDFFQSKKSAFC